MEGHILFFWLISVNIISSKFIHVVECVSLFLNSIPLNVYTTFCLSIHLSHGLLEWSHVLAIVNNATFNMGLEIVLWDLGFHSFEDIPRSETAESYSNSIFNFLRNHHSVFPSNYTTFHSHQYLFFVFLIVAILMVWSCISWWFRFAFP